MKKILKDNNNKYSVPKIILFSLILIFIIVTIISSFTTVQSGEVGLKVRFGKIINTGVAVNYRIDVDKVTSLYKTVGNNYETVVLIPAVKESIKSAIAQYNAEEITTNRTAVSISCLEAIQSKVEKYGIIIEDFNLTDFSFSEEYTKAIEEKQVAEQNLEKAKLEAEAKVAQAQGEADANALLQKTLTDAVLMEKFIEKWDGNLPDTYAGNDIMGMFNLN